MPGMSDDVTRVAVAGATGWTGRAVCDGVLDADDLALTGAVARQAVGHDLGELLGREPVGVHVAVSVEHAVADADVLVDYTSPTAVKGHALAAIERGVAVVIGTSGLSAADFADLDAAAREHGVGVVAAGNFSLTAALAQAAALLAARFLPRREIIDLASETKPDAAKADPAKAQPEQGKPAGDQPPPAPK